VRRGEQSPRGERTSDQGHEDQGRPAGAGTNDRGGAGAGTTDREGAGTGFKDTNWKQNKKLHTNGKTQQNQKTEDEKIRLTKKREKKKEKKKKTKTKTKQKTKNIHIRDRKYSYKKYKNKVFLNTIYNTEKYNTNTRTNTTTKMYHNIPQNAKNMQNRNKIITSTQKPQTSRITPRTYITPSQLIPILEPINKKSKHKSQQLPHQKAHIRTTYKNIIHPKNNNNSINRNSIPKPQTQPPIPPKIIDQKQATPTNQKSETNLSKNAHDINYKIKNTTKVPHNVSKPPTRPKNRKIKHLHLTYHKMQTQKTNTHENKPTRTYTSLQKLTQIPTITTHKIKIIRINNTTKVTQSNKKTKKHTPIKDITLAFIITKTPQSSKNKKTQQIKNIPTPNIRPIYTFHNRKTLLKCGDIESNPGSRPTFLSNHPQIYLEQQKTYFYNKTTQIKPEYSHILEIFKPYLYHTQTININHI
jgi:hypothetical protein